MAKFISKSKNLVLCIKPKRTQIIDGIPIPVEGEHVRFHNHEFETTDKKVIDWLKSHRLFNVAFTSAAAAKEISEPKTPEPPAE